MKQLFRTTLCAILSMLALSACNDDLPTMTDVLQPSPSNDPAACVLMGDDFCWDEAETRTSLTVEDNVALFSWTTGDLVGILPDAGAQVYFAIPEPATPAGGEGDEEQATEQRLNASFDGGAWALKPESSYAAYYPFIKDFDLDRTAVPVDYTGQAQTGNGSTAHLGAFDFMGARPATTNESGGVAFDFDHVGALVELKFTVPNEGTALKSVTLTADGAAFTVKGAYDLTTEEGFPITAATEGGTANEMIIGLDYTTTEANEEVIVYFMCAPIDLTGKLINVSVAYGESDDLLYFETQGKNLQAGRGSRLHTEISYPYLTFTADAEQTFKITAIGMGLWGFSLPESLQYSVGGGDWTQLTADTPIYFGGVNGSLRLRGKSSIGTADDSSNYSQISFGKDEVEVACTGDIRTLVDWENYDTAVTKEARFCNLFQGCTSLVTAPELPAETLTESCYSYMFYGCTSLTTAPKLPAKNLATSCYDSMFKDCTSLVTAPELPAETLAHSCYYEMFYGCTKLETAPSVLPANTLAGYCYNSMFYGCTLLTTAPVLPAETLAESCYYRMFQFCTSLSSITMLATDISAEDCLESWVSNVAKSGTFTKAAAMTSLPNNSSSGIPKNWTVVDYTEPTE